MQLHRRGLMLVLSSPSGAGKTTISRRLLDGEPDLRMSVSVTTRAPRKGEVPGVDYDFVDRPTFQRMIERHELLEHAEVFGNHYGTPRAPVDAVLEAGQDVLFDIDWQGTQQVKEVARDDLVSVFILPPSHAELHRRLRQRAQDSDEVVAARMAKAAGEMSHYAEYDYIVVNDDLDRSVAAVRSILAAERIRHDRYVGLRDFVSWVSESA